MSRVALFGGSFNPPHVAHQLVALYVLETQPVDELWFVPVAQHVFGKPLAPFVDRARMCELAAGALGPRVRTSRAEEVLARAPGFQGSRTHDLLTHLRAADPALAPRLVVGTDILEEASKWHRWDDVVALAPLIVVGRTGHPLADGSAATGVTMPEISSTAIRAGLEALTPEARAAIAGDPDAAGQLRALLPGPVLRYIAERDLYRAASSP